MANEKQIPELLLKILENLNTEDLKKFQTHLVQGVRDSSPGLPTSELERATVKATVDLMVQIYGEREAIDTCEFVLKMMNQTLLAQSLAGLKGGFCPETPYELVLYEGLKDQTSITIHGMVKPNADRFKINFWNSEDVAFHFNPRFLEDGKPVIVRNSKFKNVWQTEEREAPFFPFTPGKPFEMKILCTSTEFRVDVDNKHLLTFTHRVKDLARIRRLSIEQDVFLKSVRVDPVPLWMTSLYTRFLDDVISENMCIMVHGHVKPSAELFTIDVMGGSDILFHFKPYFSKDGSQVIVRNSLIGNAWGPEETHTPVFPFARGKPFLVKILCAKGEFKVDVNGSHLLDYKYRQPDITKINKVNIRQDVIATSIRVEPCRCSVLTPSYQ
ncbi:hypothetical protein NFI96_006359 [Prochilodus magdalenae]|nr:hypothetical protein NFI96_006359 [Prochilodus magdalenae]